MSFWKSFVQSGGGNGGSCSLCGSPGVTKATCPCNPKAKNPNPAKHPKAKNVCPGKVVSKKVICKKGPGFDFLNKSIDMTLLMEDINQISGEFDDNLMDFRPLTPKNLNSVVADCKKIQLKLPAWTEEGQHTLEVVASGKQITVKDILKVFIKNNKELVAAAEGSSLGDHVYYEGMDHEGGNVFSMMNYGS